MLGSLVSKQARIIRSTTYTTPPLIDLHSLSAGCTEHEAADNNTQLTGSELAHASANNLMWHSAVNSPLYSLLPRAFGPV